MACLLLMNPREKLNLDYKILHTSGLKVIKNNMTETLVQEDLDSVSDLDEFMEDHNPQDLETKDEAENIIAKFEKIMERFKRCQSEPLGRDTEISILDVKILKERSVNISVNSRKGLKSHGAKNSRVQKRLPHTKRRVNAPTL